MSTNFEKSKEFKSRTNNLQKTKKKRNLQSGWGWAMIFTSSPVGSPIKVRTASSRMMVRKLTSFTDRIWSPILRPCLAAGLPSSTDATNIPTSFPPASLIPTFFPLTKVICLAEGLTKTISVKTRWRQSNSSEITAKCVRPPLRIQGAPRTRGPGSAASILERVRECHGRWMRRNVGDGRGTARGGL